MRVTLKAVNAELARLGRNVDLAKGAGYFLFRGGVADSWVDRTVRVPTIGSPRLEQDRGFGYSGDRGPAFGETTTGS
jgi:hypothetical protein